MGSAPLVDRSKPEILLVSSCYMMGLARQPWVFRQAGFRVVVMAPPNVPVWMSRHIDERIEVDASPQGIIERLHAFLTEHPNRFAWVILEDDPTIHAIQPFLEESWVKNWFPFAPEIFETIVHKDKFYLEMQHQGIRIPRTRIANSQEEQLAAAREIGFPIIRKPIDGHAGKGIQVFETERTLHESTLTDPESPRAIIQQFVVGRNAVTEALYHRGRPIMFGSWYKERAYPGKFGPSCFRRSLVMPEIEELHRRIGEITGFHGFGCQDLLIEEGTGDLYLIEMNSRPGSGIHLFGNQGLDWKRVLASFITDEPFVQIPRQDLPECTVAMFPQDLMRSVSEESLLEFAKRWFGRESWIDYPTDDPALGGNYKKMLRAMALNRVKAPARRALGLKPGMSLRSKFKRSAEFKP